MPSTGPLTGKQTSWFLQPGPPATKNELTVGVVEERQLAETCLQYRRKQRTGTGETNEDVD